MKKLVNRLLPRLYGAYFNLIALFSPKKAAERAFTLFCTPRKGKVLPVQSDFLEKAQYQQHQIGGKNIQSYRWAGDKETVLLLHGWESNSFRWRNLISFLQDEGYNVIAFDAPAHGNSAGKIFNVPLYAECTQEFVKEYRPRYVVAHSLGGMTALYHQYQYPANGIEKLVSVGAPSDLPEIMHHYQHMLRFNNRVMQALDDYFMKHFGFRIADFSTARFARNIPTKGLLIHDELDQVTPFHASERVHANWKNSEFIRTRGLGHSLHQEEVNNQIVDFLKS